MAKKTQTASDAEREGGQISLVAAVVANLAIALAKGVAFVFTGSTSMLAEALHSIADTSKQVFLFIGRARSRAGADPEHPFGYGPEQYYWALLVAIVLFPLGAAYTLFESIGKLGDPQPMTHPGWAIATVLAAMLFEGLSLRIAIRQARRAGARGSLWRYVRQTRSPDIAAVLVEDAGAVVGLGIALMAIIAALATADPRYDALGGIAIAMLLLAMAWVLAVEMKSLVIGESATPAELLELRRAILRSGSVRSIQSLKTLHLAPDQVLVVARVEFDGSPDLPALALAIQSIQGTVCEELPWVHTLHVEPVTPTHSA